MASRGYRNNNPGNIRISDTVWNGQVSGNDAEFVTFKSMEYGYRAIFVMIRNGYLKKGFDTIEKIINRYAPPVENNTENYISRVVDLTKIPRGQKLSFSESENMIKLVAAISWVENGTSPDFTKVTSGYELASGSTVDPAIKTIGFSFVAFVIVSVLGFVTFNLLKS